MIPALDVDLREARFKKKKKAKQICLLNKWFVSPGLSVEEGSPNRSLMFLMAFHFESNIIFFFFLVKASFKKQAADTTVMSKGSKSPGERFI